MVDLNSGDDLNGLLGAMSELQQHLARAEADANSRVIVGSAAEGRVTIEVSGEFSFNKVKIDPSVIDPGDIALLEDLILAALRDAAGQLKAVRTSAMGGAVSEMLGDLFGSGDVEPPQEGNDTGAV